MEALGQQQAAIAVDGEAGVAFDGAVEEAVGVGLLGGEAGDEGAAGLEGGVEGGEQAMLPT